MILPSIRINEMKLFLATSVGPALLATVLFLVVVPGCSGEEGSEGGGDGSGGMTDAGERMYPRECSPVGRRTFIRHNPDYPEGDLQVHDLVDCSDWQDEQTDKPDYSTSAKLLHFSLDPPMIGGESYAISWQKVALGEDLPVRIWGMDGACGARQELLFEGGLQPETSCVEMTPSENYEYVLIEFIPYANQTYDSMTYCPRGTCGL